MTYRGGDSGTIVKMEAASPAVVEASGPTGRREGTIRRLLDQYDKNGSKTYEEVECVARARTPRAARPLRFGGVHETPLFGPPAGCVPS